MSILIVIRPDRLEFYDDSCVTGRGRRAPRRSTSRRQPERIAGREERRAQRAGQWLSKPWAQRFRRGAKGSVEYRCKWSTCAVAVVTGLGSQMSRGGGDEQSLRS
ncbi:hypothetical protein N9L68_03145 [bacterium]|nr:hypothetical protein [bacterium]